MPPFFYQTLGLKATIYVNPYNIFGSVLHIYSVFSTYKTFQHYLLNPLKSSCDMGIILILQMRKLRLKEVK